MSDRPPTVFISYARKGDAHVAWVEALATRLRTKDGLDVTLDRWEIKHGNQLPAFMERSVRDSHNVVMVCTPGYRAKFDERTRGSGVAYEARLIAAEIFTGRHDRKFIPIHRAGDWRDAAPSVVLGSARIDLRGDPYQEGGL